MRKSRTIVIASLLAALLPAAFVPSASASHESAFDCVHAYFMLYLCQEPGYTLGPHAFVVKVLSDHEVFINVQPGERLPYEEAEVSVEKYLQTEIQPLPEEGVYLLVYFGLFPGSPAFSYAATVERDVHPGYDTFLVCVDHLNTEASPENCAGVAVPFHLPIV